MKTKLLTLALLTVALATFAQGKIIIGNDSLHLIVSEMGVPISSVGGWTDLSMALMGGTSAGSMTLQTTIVGDLIASPAVADGRINNRTWTLVGVGPGVSASLQLLFYSTAAGSYENAATNWPTYRHGESPVFTVTAGSFAYNSIVLHGAPGNSTWADNPVYLFIPEPSIAALTGVATLLMIFRRRQR